MLNSSPNKAMPKRHTNSRQNIFSPLHSCYDTSAAASSIILKTINSSCQNPVIAKTLNRNIENNMRILLVEDTIDIAFAIASKLEKEGYAVTTAYDGVQGEDLAVNGSFDVVVLDINLPGRDGFAILRSMRERSLSCPVLVITARNQIADKLDVLELGADDYLVKPFDLRELVARIRAVARRHMGVSQPLLHIGDLSINLTQRSVMQGDEPLDFGRREFDVLEMLATRINVAVPKDMLVLKLFGHDDTGTPNAIELLISRVRKKLESSNLEIVTQRGVGYLLRPKLQHP